MLERNTVDPEAKKSDKPPISIAFGLERIGLIAMRAPILSCIILFAMVIGAVFGIERIKIDDSLSQLFRSNTKEYRQYEEVTKRFPSTEFDVLVVVEGKTLLRRDNLEKIRDLVTDLQLVEGTRGLISLFSARQAPAPGKLPAALFPADLPQGADYDKFIETVKTNEIIRGKLLSEDGTLALIVLSLEPSIVGNNGLKKTIGEIRKIMATDLADTGLSKELSGVPVMQLEIRNAVERDGLIYNVAGILAGCLIAILFFRKVSFMIVAAFPPLLAILLSLGILGWAGFSLNMFLNVMTPLIMVISFSDSMQLTFAARDRLLAGEDRFSAFRNAVLVVGPACVLTHATAGISFLALQFSDSDLIRTFGEAGLAATIIALLAVLSLVPVFGVLLVRNEQVFAAKFQAADAGVNALRAFCYWIAVRMVGRPGLFSLIAVVVCRRPRPDLRQSGTALSAGRSGPRQAAGGGGQRTARRQADRRQSDRHPDRIPQGRVAVCARDVASHRGRPFDGRNPGRRRQRLVARDVAALAGRKGRQFRRRDPEGICQRDSGASGPALHLGRSGCSGGIGQGAGPRFQRDPAGGREARRRAGHRPQEASGI